MNNALDNAFEGIAAEDVPHVADHLRQAVDWGADREAVEAKANEIFGRSLGLENAPTSKREAFERRPVSDPKPFEFGDQPDVEDRRTDEETLEDALDRVFGKDEPAQRSTPKPPKPEAAEPANTPVNEVPSELRSPADVQTAMQIGMAQAQLKQDAARFMQQVAYAEQLAAANPSMAAEIRQAVELDAALLRNRHQALSQVEQGITATVDQQKCNNEWRQLKSKLPDTDPQKLRAYLRGTGYTDEQIDSVRDHRDFVLVEKARRWDEQQAQQKLQPKPQPKIVQRAKVVTRKQDDRAVLQRANRTGNYDNIEGALDRRLSEIFR